MIDGLFSSYDEYSKSRHATELPEFNTEMPLLTINRKSSIQRRGNHSAEPGLNSNRTAWTEE